ncbi:rnase p rpr2 rpp21 subunit domain-containing [Trichoderma cornu-damae]|uniref:Rnase p rpr2 rpp21 subunit domain-containing n=1 Tax=Trichoderma cornu-damae TaxID=654480 RepID=A0A9P8TW85_9HYPO|nr:rnase p rpr2 rpp21 subunit domain-containing [Trichoderma cornu-damae]
MAKSKGNAGIQNRHLYTRASYLYQAASYLAHCAQQTKNEARPEESRQGEDGASSPIRRNASPSGMARDDGFAHSRQERKAMMSLSRQAVSDMRLVSLKGQIRQSPSIKRTMCKYCDAVLIEGKTCRSVVENLSRGGRKPWADILATLCNTCGHVKREKQKQKQWRQQQPICPCACAGARAPGVTRQQEMWNYAYEYGTFSYAD